ncbi:hypothetical protein SPAN111604_01085 [Sphingomonas antarctica]|uniref:hypothetical protein n=1 Tax=Sphingomonas antarctica TaxID=2040274 RepID=UPI0039EA9E1C
MSKSITPHSVPASGLFGSTWHLSRERGTAPTVDQFEARYVANDRLAGDDAPKRANRFGLVA